MPKILCIISLIISSILLLVFLLNVFSGIPFGTAKNMFMDIGMIIGSGIVVAFSVLTFLENR